MDSIKDQLSFYASALQLRGKRNNILASNIANAATPNYKARDISFEDEIKKFDLKMDQLKLLMIIILFIIQVNQFNEASYREPLVLHSLRWKHS